jgi:hypothetical protein
MQANSSSTTRNLRSVGTWFLSSLTSMGVCRCNLVSLSCFWHSVLKVCIFVVLLLGVSTESVKTILKQVISHSRSEEKKCSCSCASKGTIKIVSSFFCLQPLSWGEGKIYAKIALRWQNYPWKIGTSSQTVLAIFNAHGSLYVSISNLWWSSFSWNCFFL